MSLWPDVHDGNDRTISRFNFEYRIRMSEWTKERLERMIADGDEENLSLDYKRAASLDRADGKKSEITKDVSSFANSAGGVLIYGIAEPEEKTKRHLPERLDPVCRADFSKEWLEQIIQSIQPRIEGVVIHPVTVDEQAGTVCYVVEVPPSHTAHQARDHVYYKRHNFGALPMEDYEVRDVMNRKTHPKIRASIFINKTVKIGTPEGVILVKVENIGRTLARYVMVEIELPIDVGGLIRPVGVSTLEKNDEGEFWRLRVGKNPQTPIFPGSYSKLDRKFDTNVVLMHNDGSPMVSTRQLKVSVFADEMPPLRATMDVASVLRHWTPIEQSSSI